MQIIDKLITSYFQQQLMSKGKSFVAKNIIAKFFTKLVCFDKHGLLFEIDPRDLVQRSILTNGEWESNESAVLREILQPGQVFFDIGANFGYFSLLASKLVGPSGHVISFEPNPIMKERLERNLALNQINNVKVFPVALSDRFGTQDFYISQSNNSGLSSLRQLDNYLEKITVCTVILDDFITQNGLPKPDFVKMDIEGAEHIALLGMKKTLAAQRDIGLLIEISDHFLRELGSDEEILLAYLKANGFTTARKISQHSRTTPNGKPLYYTQLMYKNHEYI